MTTAGANEALERKSALGRDLGYVTMKKKLETKVHNPPLMWHTLLLLLWHTSRLYFGTRGACTLLLHAVAYTLAAVCDNAAAICCASPAAVC